MKESENYLELLVTEYQVQVLTVEDFRDTLKYYAKLHHTENSHDTTIQP